MLLEQRTLAPRGELIGVVQAAGEELAEDIERFQACQEAAWSVLAEDKAAIA